MDLSKHAFFEGKIVPLADAKINIATHGFLYGTAVFGGMRSYWNEEKKRLFVFRPYDHFRRLLHSARMMSMQTHYDEESLIQLTLDLLRTDNWRQDIYMRPSFYKADLGIGVRLHDLKDEFCMFVIAYEPYVKNDTNAHVTISSWRRIDDNVIPARGKVAGAYANSALIKTDANRSGFDEALVLDNNGHISEGSAMNVFMPSAVSIFFLFTFASFSGRPSPCLWLLARRRLSVVYRPLNSGRLRSTNAVIPSCLSSVAKVNVTASDSKARPASKPDCNAWLMAALARPTASGPCLAMRVASRCASAINW